MTQVIEMFFAPLEGAISLPSGIGDSFPKISPGAGLHFEMKAALLYYLFFLDEVVPSAAYYFD